MPEVPDPSLTQPLVPSAPDDVDNELLDKTNAFDHTPMDRTPIRSGSSGTRPTGFNPRSGEQNLGRSVGGFRLHRLLGEGGMGRVYEASDDSGRMVAIKLLSPELSRSPEALERFKQEGVIASAISHPHCVFVHAADEDRGTPFIAMELMTGLTLKDLVAKRGPLPVDQALPLIIQCIDGLIEAHSQGMIHRDVKPANCYLDDQGNVKIGDFGLARSLVTDSELTRTGTFLGTPLYSSPEQILGETVDEQSDIYSLSATLFFLLAGKAPFESPNAPQVIAKIVSADPPTFEEMGVQVPKNIEVIVRKGLARDRSKRFKSFAEFHDELAAVLKDSEKTATLGRRFVAYVIDMILVSFLLGGFMLSVFAIGGGRIDLKDYANLIGTLWQFLYLFVLETMLGTTVGKLVLNVRILNPVDRTKPTWRQCFIRAGVFVLALNLLEFVVAGGLTLVSWNDFAEGLIGGLASFVGLILGTIVLLAPWMRTGKRQLLHERASNTETWVASPKAVSTSIELPSLDWKLAMYANATEFPSRLGRYEIAGRIRTSPESHWLFARDSTIDRCVWIQVNSLESNTISESREKCSRRTRMRYLESGYDETFRWDAYVAPDGAPVGEWFDYRQPMPWQVTRIAIREILAELNASESHAVELVHNLQCWWLSSTGKLTLTEVAIDGTRTKTTDGTSLFSELAKLALPNRGRDSSVDSENASVRHAAKFPLSVPPLRAAHLMADLKKGRIPNPKLIGNLLHRVEQGEQVATVKMRAVHTALLAIVLSVPALFGIGVYLIPAVISMVESQRDAQSFTNLAAVVKNFDEHAQLLEQIDAPMRSVLQAPNFLTRVESAADKRFEQFRSAYSHLGLFEKAVIDQQNKIMGRESVHSKPQPELLMLNALEHGDEENEIRPDIEILTPDRGKPNFVIKERKPSIANWITDFERWEQTEKEPKAWLTSRRRNRLIQMCLIPFSILIFWGGLTRGGLSHWFTGLAVVKKSGARAGFWQSLLRSLLFWSPFLVLAFGIVFLDTHGTEYLWWSQQLRRTMMILPLIYLVLVIRFPQRGPHDWASGTHVVPR